MKHARRTSFLLAILVGGVLTAGLAFVGTTPSSEIANRTVLEPSDVQLAERVDFESDGAPLRLAERINFESDGRSLSSSKELLI